MNETAQINLSNTHAGALRYGASDHLPLQAFEVAMFQTPLRIRLTRMGIQLGAVVVVTAVALALLGLLAE